MSRYALVRHPPAANAAGLCYGRLDLPLADPDDVAGIVATLSAMRGAAIHASPLARCRRVAEALAAGWGQSVALDDRLMEMDFGAWEGLAWEDVPRAALDLWAGDILGFAPPGGETGAALIRRVTDFWRRLAAQGGAHVVITHGGPLKVLTALAEGRPVDLSIAAPAPGSVSFIGRPG